MKVAAVVLARMTSSRFPGKVLSKIAGQMCLEAIATRLQLHVPNTEIVLATSDAQSDDRLELAARSLGIHCYRGSLTDVSERFLFAGESVSADVLIRVNADNVFGDRETLNQAITAVSDRGYDFATNVPERTFPFGLSTEVVSTVFYRAVQMSFITPAHQEHVTSYLYDNPTVGNRFEIRNTRYPELKGLDLALDTPEDAARIERIARLLELPLEEIGLEEIARFQQLSIA